MKTDYSTYSDSSHSAKIVLLLKNKTETNLLPTRHNQISKPKDLLRIFFAPILIMEGKTKTIYTKQLLISIFQATSFSLPKARTPCCIVFISSFT